MAMRVSGINSGLDTDAIVQELVSAYSKKTEKYEKEQTKLSWKQDIWSSLNSKVYSLYTNISKLRFSSAYAIKKVTSSDSSKATVSASGNAVNGTQKLNVLKTAQSAYLTSGKVSSADGSTVKSDTTLEALGFTSKSNLCVKTKDAEGNDISTNIELKKDDTVADVVTKLQDAGLNASFDEKQGRFYISSKLSGKNGDFTIEAATTKKMAAWDDDGNPVKDKDGNQVYEDVETTPEERAMSNWLLDAIGLGSNETLAGGEVIARNGKTAALTTPGSELGVPAEGAKFEVEIDGKKQTITVDTSTRISDILKQFQDAGVNAKFDGTTGQFVFQNANTVSFSAVGTADEQAAGNALLKKLGLTDGNGTKTLAARADKAPHKISGEDAEIELNGVRYTNNTNEFSINGLDITAQGVTGEGADNAITLSVSTDTQGLYDTIKDFLTQYNNIINEITKLYNADTAKGYDPLTDEEKDAMSDTEIEKWETKIKDSLLRRDSSLDAIMSAMINSMNKGIVINDKTYSLSTFGIHTLGFLNAVENEHNAFHIDGDEDDENTANEEDELMKAIKADPDTVIEFMKQLTSNLYTAIDDQMKGTSLRTKYKIYNDKEMDKQYQEYTKTISEWEKKVSDKEDYYYKKFSAMETALAKLNSQQSSLAGLLGN